MIINKDNNQQQFASSCVTLKQRMIFARIIIAVTVLRAAFSFLSLIAAVNFQLIIIAKSVFKDLSFKTVVSKFVARWPLKVEDLSLNRFPPLELFE